MIAAGIILAASGQEQELVLVYAVPVFVSFLAGLLAMARFSRRAGSTALAVTNVVALSPSRLRWPLTWLAATR